MNEMNLPLLLASQAQWQSEVDSFESSGFETHRLQKKFFGRNFIQEL
jgi:hypothetical protein